MDVALEPRVVWRREVNWLFVHPGPPGSTLEVAWPGLEREREGRLRPEMLAPPAPEWSYTPEEQYRAGELGQEIERRIRALAPWQLDAFRLRHIEDLTIQEISRRTTRSEDAVRSGLYRAKRLLFEAAEIEESDE